jgi:hypothetical protein
MYFFYLLLINFHKCNFNNKENKFYKKFIKISVYIKKHLCGIFMQKSKFILKK